MPTLLAIVQMKICTCCKAEKEGDRFYSDKSKGDLLSTQCKDCVNAKQRSGHSRALAKINRKKRYEARKQEFLARNKVWRVANQKLVNALNLDWANRNRDKRKKIANDWQKRNPHKSLLATRRRQAAAQRACVSWAIEFFIEEAYVLAKLREAATGIKWHVDHIVPFRSNTVCGLHTHSNLQVIPAVANISKSNRYWPDMP